MDLEGLVHLHRMVRQWVEQQWRWQGQPLSRHLTTITLWDQRRPTVVWPTLRPGTVPVPGVSPSVADTSDTGNAAAHGARGAEQADLQQLAQAAFDWRHPVWERLAAAWALEGTWLHPETGFTINPVALAESASYLYIACVDRDDPAAPRRYDPARHAAVDPHTIDLGIIAFPLHPHQALDYLAAGLPPAQAMLVTAGTAVVEACVHEALETYQHSPGRPVRDPHQLGPELRVRLHWRLRHHLSHRLLAWTSHAWPCPFPNGHRVPVEGDPAEGVR
ncbi:hypothetical protein [Actinomadura kijaniata]|uniref:hypothetical protein n=1 Tax=Actinomadura kijaniata TaxID=46161 RepID=UPI0012FAED6D|nr:hypothetical protein [Actinomadura kijaniata]